MKQSVDAISDLSSSTFVAQQHKNDPLRRFVPTLYTAALPVMGRTVRLKTNSPAILDHMMELFALYPGSDNGSVDFTWTIVSQADVDMCPPWPKRHAFSDDGVRFAEYGQRNFMAVDVEAREAVAFIAEGLCADRVGFTSPFLDNLFCMTASSLEFMSLRANCVALNGKGLLVFGAPSSGKTSASYLATKLGLEFYGDEGVFAEIRNGAVRAWGGFWPPAFRPKALQFLPELQAHTRPLYYLNSTFHHLSASRIRTAPTAPVTPTGCVFLERHAGGATRVSKIDCIELQRLLFEGLLFKEDERFSEQYAKILAQLANLPAYHFAYPCDPALAAAFFQDVLESNDILG